jgi:hypothetical protein
VETPTDSLGTAQKDVGLALAPSGHPLKLLGYRGEEGAEPEVLSVVAFG